MKTNIYCKPRWRLMTLAVLAATAIHAQADDDETELAQQPLFVSESFPPLNMLVMGRDHKLYYEAYNDASDLNGDGVLDIGYKPDEIEYYGYFNNYVCYNYIGDTGTAKTVAAKSGSFVPVSKAGGDNGKKCSSAWSGDFLNYVATSRMDAMRKVLYGGWRTTDSDDPSVSTVLQAAYIPRDAHSWAKAYEASGENYDITEYTPLAKPKAGTRHLLAITSLGETGEGSRTQLRVLNDTRWQIWDWVSQETDDAHKAGSAGQDFCNRGGGGVIASQPCEHSGGEGWSAVGANSYRNLTLTTWKITNHVKEAENPAGMNNIFNKYAKDTYKCGSGTIDAVLFSGENSNPFAGNNGCTDEWHLARMEGEIFIPEAGTYTFSVHANDSSQVTIDGATTWGWYHGWGVNDLNDWISRAPGWDHATGDSNGRTKKINFTSPGWKKVKFDYVKYEDKGIWGLGWKINLPQSKIVGYNVKVKVCPANKPELHEDNCKKYENNGSPVYQPTGLLHDFGESRRMFFGLTTGSYAKNVAGGVVRTNIGFFDGEIDSETGQFQSGGGIVDNINRLQLTGFDGGHYYGQSGGKCPWEYNKPLSAFDDPSVCDMWGNPIAEMMFETLRYFAGAGAGHSKFQYAGNSRDKALGLSKPVWKHPYTTMEFPHCARPVMTVFSDINPSFDFKLPGSKYQSIAAEISGNPLSGLNVANETTAIGAAEGIHGKQFFIGQSTLLDADSAPTEKTINDLAYARGLSPQEPSRQGTYYAAGVARFGARNKIAGNFGGMNPVMTYSVALASPLPEINIPVGSSGKYVKIAPFAKTIGSTGGHDVGAGDLQATNQIVDFYIERIANTGVADKDDSVNAGRPFVKFRINYEDIEQGADHDMDMIVTYTIWVDADNKINVSLDSTYASGPAIQHAGYVISGTTQDGVYIEVRDIDTKATETSWTYYRYRYNTPPGRTPGYCKDKPKHDPECKVLPLTTSRQFTASSTGSAAGFLKDPLWYAAKYGIPGRDPSSVTGDPNNYFLVTNAGTLKDQLTKAFNDILQASSSITAPVIDIPKGPLTGEADTYRTVFDIESGWSGDVIKEAWEKNPPGVPGDKITKTWSAAEKLAQNSNRKIYFSGTNGLKEFVWSEVSNDTVWRSALDVDPDSGSNDGKAEERVAFLRGENDSFRDRPLLPTGERNLLGDIVNSSPVRVSGAAWQVAAANLLEGNNKYADFAAQQASMPRVLYVGANDGMLHAFRADNGEEVFAFIPSALRKHLNKLTHPNYGSASWGNGAHRYFVDGSPVVADVYFANAWHKVLIGSLGAGGRQVFALDVTNPSTPKLLWEFGHEQDENMGHSLAEPLMVRLNDRANGKWVALVPGGYEHGGDKHEANLFVLDIRNGAVIRKFSMNGRQGMTDNTYPEEYLPLGNGLSRINTIDQNRDGMADVAYAGDLLGNLWRFDLESTNASKWKVEKLFVAQDADGIRQPITAAPYIKDHPTGEGFLVVFGTGRFVVPNDQNTWQNQSLYGIWDRGDSAINTAGIDRNYLQMQEFEEFADLEGVFHLTKNAVEWFDNAGNVKKWGWFVDFPMEGERLIFNMKAYGKALLVSTLNPGESGSGGMDSCSAGIGGALYAVNPTTGGALDFPVFDLNDDGVFDEKDMICDGAGVCIPPSNLPPDISWFPRPPVFGGGNVSTGDASRVGLNSGIEYARQSWREQPPNP